MKHKTNQSKKIFQLTIFLILISGINTVHSQSSITDAGVQMHETTAGMECRFVIVVEDTSNVQQLEVKLGSSAGNYSLVNAVFDFDVTGGLPSGYSYQRNGNTITLVTGIFRTNPVTSSNISHYFDDQFSLSQSLNNNTHTFNGYSEPGLYGIDVMGFDNSSRIASDWQHYPVVALPTTPSNLDKILIFHIKDSYQEFHHQRVWNAITACNTLLPPTFGTNATGIYKQVELNGIPVWRQDIAQGGDGWQRVEVDLTSPNSVCACNPIEDLPNTDGTKNTISFSIAFDNNANDAINVHYINGLLVWVDDVYLKRTTSDTGDNLIPDGTIENSLAATDLAIGGPNEKNKWYRLSLLPVFEECVEQVLGTNRMAEEGRAVEGDSLPVEEHPESYAVCSTPTVTGNAQINSIERKSGKQALQLKLPRFKLPNANNPNDPNNDCRKYKICPDFINTSGDYTRVISAYTDIDFTDLLTCSDYSGFGYTSFPCSTCNTSATHSSLKYNLDHDVQIQNGCILEFKGSQIAISAGKKITIKSGGKLVLDKYTINNVTNFTSLFACGNMWAGITIEPGGQIQVRDGSRISDAITAIEFDGGGSTSGTRPIIIKGNSLQPVIFDQNMVSLKLANGNLPADNNIGNCILAAKFICSNGPISREPCNGMYPESHIIASNITGLRIGYYGQPSKVLFSDANNGIKILNSSVNIQKCEFKNIYDYDPVSMRPYRGIAIDIQGPFSPARTVNIGDPANPGIDEILFNNVNIGVRAVMDFPSLSENLTLRILKCKFDNSAFKHPNVLWPFYNTAITIQNFLPSQMLSNLHQVSIYSNEIKSHRIGIHAINVPGIQIGDAGANKISFNLGNGSGITDYHAGVWLQNCNDAHVVGEGDNSKPDIQNNAAASGTNLFRGIDVENSTHVRVNCNVIADIPLPINLTGNCDLSKLRYNKMSGYEHGVNLDPNAFIPTQGDLDAGSGQFIPYDNQWSYAGNEPPNILKVSETNSSVLWYYQGSTINTNTYCPMPSSPLITPQWTPLTGNNDCLDFSRYADRENSIGKAVYDSLQFNENVEENIYMAKLAAYRALKTDSLLLDQGKADDYIYYDFLSDMNQSNAKLFDSIYVLIQDTATLTDAQNLNSSITGTNNVEYCRKAVNDLLISYLISGELSSGDTTVLDSIARLPLSLAGDAIYTAAALLGLEIHQQFNIQQERKAEIKIDPQKPPTVRDVFMYPNPAFDKAYFYLKPLQQEELVLIEIYDSNGNKIMMLPAPTNDTYALDVRTFAAGMYSFTITANKKVFKGTFIKSK